MSEIQTLAMRTSSAAASSLRNLEEWNWGSAAVSGRCGPRLPEFSPMTSSSTGVAQRKGARQRDQFRMSLDIVTRSSMCPRSLHDSSRVHRRLRRPRVWATGRVRLRSETVVSVTAQSGVGCRLGSVIVTVRSGTEG